MGITAFEIIAYMKEHGVNYRTASLELIQKKSYEK